MSTRIAAQPFRVDLLLASSADEMTSIYNNRKQFGWELLGPIYEYRTIHGTLLGQIICNTIPQSRLEHGAPGGY